jgi:branched-chain amino acid transport system ATP-binding protein
MLLEVRDLRVHYGKAEVLKGISFKVDQAEVVALIGANGAGKTTTLRTISGLKMPTSGEIWFNGMRVDKLPAHERTRIGIAHIPEGRKIFSALTVEKNIEIGAYIRRDKRGVLKDVEKMYKTFPILRERRGQLAGTLSGGEQQMLTTARGLMSMPKLLLMDEPSLGLSPLVVREVAHIIRNISQGGTSILLVEQNALLALQLASRAYVLEVGNIALEGEAQQLLNDEGLREAYLGF